MIIYFETTAVIFAIAYIFLAMKDRKNDGYYCHKPFLDAKNRAEESLG